jgi:hypothetical protein
MLEECREKEGLISLPLHGRRDQGFQGFSVIPSKCNAKVLRRA